MTLFFILFKHAWAMFIFVNIINAFIFKQSAKPYIQAQPELAAGYNRYIKGWLLIGNIPWVIIMIGNLSGLTNSLFDYFSPKSLNPMVLAFHGTVVMIWLLGFRWIYFQKGAEFFEKHPGLLRMSTPGASQNITAKNIKRLYPLMVLGGAIGMVMMWVMDIPVVQFE
jgi:hypothetical protein